MYVKLSRCKQSKPALITLHYLQTKSQVIKCKIIIIFRVYFSMLLFAYSSVFKINEPEQRNIALDF